MKSNLLIKKSYLIGIVLFFKCSIYGFSQGNTYNCYLKNITYVDSRNLEFEIWLEWTGTNTNKFQLYQAGIDFNYAGLAAGGTMTGRFVAGSADPSLPAGVQQSPNWNAPLKVDRIRLWF